MPRIAPPKAKPMNRNKSISLLDKTLSEFEKELPKAQRQQYLESMRDIRDMNLEPNETFEDILNDIHTRYGKKEKEYSYLIPILTAIIALSVLVYLIW